jgi:hypothetical protein
MRPVRVGTYQPFVTFVIEEYNSAPAPVIKHYDLIRSLGSRLLAFHWLGESVGKQSRRHDDHQQV